MGKRSYNAGGLLRLCAAAIELVPMIVNGSDQEVQQAVAKIYAVARHDFPDGPRSAGTALNDLCAELDLAMVFSARNKDTGELL